VEDSDKIKHIRGDLYSLNQEIKEGACIGYYNPVYQAEENKPTKYFLRLEEDYRFLYETEGKYESVFNKKAIPLAEYDCPVGLQELISDLEIITILYTFMNNICHTGNFYNMGLVGLINGREDTPDIKVVQIRDSSIVTNEQILDFVNNNIGSIHIDPSYPTLVFKDKSDFEIWQIDGGIKDLVKGDINNE
jgi:hypothetical protein